MNTEEKDIELTPTNERENEKKEYNTPKLTHYGGISELVQMMLNTGGDGGDPSGNLS